MNKFEPKQLTQNLEADESWLVQIYGSNRRLLCVLDPSHAWIFLVGCCTGLLLAIVWINVARYSASSTPSRPNSGQNSQIESTPPQSAMPTVSPALQVD